MIPRKKNSSQLGFFFGFADTLNPKHPLYILANRVDWQQFEDAFLPLYSRDNGRPAKPIRLMVGLLMLKHIRNISDGSVVEQWSENSYYQYFCGETSFVADVPCEASELVHFRKRIGEQGIALILKESIRINGDDSDHPDVNVDTTVQEKNVTFPTDAKLHRKIIRKCHQIAEQEGLFLRQSYRRILKKLSVDQRFRNHPKTRKKALRADKRVKVIAGRLVRELERKLEAGLYDAELALFNQVLQQTRDSKQKIYSLHEPDVQCISKGKEHKKYEFGNKVSIVYNLSGVIVGAMGFRNEYDGHTLEPALQQVEALTGKSPQTATVDRGYRGRSTIGNTSIQIPKAFSSKQSRYKQQKLKKAHRKRASIEPIIGHLKSDHRLNRNFYKGIFGDNINIMLAAAAFNFKRMMNKWKKHFLLVFQNFIYIVVAFVNSKDTKIRYAF